MLSYAEALTLIGEAAAAYGGLGEETIALAAARGRVSAVAIASEEAIPPFANSAMDGFAVLASATAEASRQHPVRFAVKSLIAAGDAPVQALSATRECAWEIMTGAPMPAGADAVVRIEDVRVERDSNGRAMTVEITQPLAGHENVRDAGEDFSAGKIVVDRGVELRAEHILALASLGVDRVRVVAKPRVAVLSTGRELVDLSTNRLKPGQIRNSTAPFLMSALALLGAEAEFYGTIADEPAEFTNVMERLLAQAPDIIITTGAVSMGKYDFVTGALPDMGAEVVFHKVAIRPGKPILFAKCPSRAGKRPVVFGLPGNAVSTAVGLRFFVVPYLRAIAGMREENLLRARLAAAVKKPEGLRCFFKARLELGRADDARIKVLPGQASFMVSPLLESTAWAVLPEHGASLSQGDWIDVAPMWPSSYDWSCA